MNFVVMESPYAGDIERNVAYARKAMKDCITRGELPFASHLLYTQVLDDKVNDQRNLGLYLNMSMISRATFVAVYTDLGISPGMEKAIAYARRWRIPVVYRNLGV